MAVPPGDQPMREEGWWGRRLPVSTRVNRANSSEKVQAAWLSLPEGAERPSLGTASETAPGPIDDSGSITLPWLLPNWAVNDRVPLRKALLTTHVCGFGDQPHPALYLGSTQGHAAYLFQLEPCAAPAHLPRKAT